jgi:hypothetical protein
VGSLPGLRITHNNLGHLRGDGEPQEPGDEFFNMLIKCQVGLQPGSPAPSAPLAGLVQAPSWLGTWSFSLRVSWGTSPPWLAQLVLPGARGCSALCTSGRPSLELRR